MKGMAELLWALPALVVVVVVCTLVVRLIYKPIVGNQNSISLSIISSAAIITIMLLYGYWVDVKGYGNGTSAHGYILGLIAIPFTFGWAGNTIFDVWKNFRQKRSD